MSCRNKIFFVGFNKTATTSLHNLLLINGYKSIHWQFGGRFIADIIECNLKSNLPVLSNIENFDGYSDFTHVTREVAIEGNRYFRELHSSFLQSWFVLNTRPLDEWLLSRLPHKDFAERYAAALNLNIPDLIDYWRDLKFNREAEIRDYFEGYEKFIEFDISTDSYSKLANFIGPEYDLQDTRPLKWNVT